MIYADSKFVSFLDIRLMWDAKGNPLANRDGQQLYKLLAPFSYQSKLLNQVITVPIDFITDFASVPRIPFVYDNLGNIAQEPAVIHDYLYSIANLPRKTADDILLEAMEITGVPWLKRKLIYQGVRLGGGSHYGTV